GQDQILASGKTDSQGLWSFPAPAPGQYMLIVDAGMGHRTREPIAVPDAAIRPDNLASPSEQQGIISESTRKDFTGFPYLKVGLGLASIFLFSLAFLVARKKNRGQSGTFPKK